MAYVHLSVSFVQMLKVSLPYLLITVIGVGVCPLQA
jgi:hypothetical protein